MKIEKVEDVKGSQPIRVALVIGKHVTGGIKSVTMNYFNFIDRNQIQFDFIVDNDSPMKDYSEIYSLGGKVYEITSVKNPIQNIIETYRLLKENKYLCVHGYINTLNVFPMFAGFLARTPVRIAENLSTAHQSEKKTVLKKILKPFAKMFPTHLAANSEFAAEWLYGKSNLSKCKIISNALDLNKFRFDPELRREKRTEMGVDGCYVIGHIGRYQFQKNHDFLVDVFNAVYKKDSTARLILIGYGELKTQIFEKIKILDLQNVVIDGGVTEEILPFYNAIDCFLLPSFYEGLPVVGIEAQATGLPCVISTEVTCETRITDVVDFVRLEESPEAWASIILQWKNYRRKDLSNQLTSNGYNIEREAHVLKEYYLNCLEGIGRKQCNSK